MSIEPIEPEICVYHGNCLDGFASAYAIWKRWPKCQFIEAFYHKPVPPLGNKHVIFVDFSYSEKVVRQITAVTKSLTIIDHHKTPYVQLYKLLHEGLVYGNFAQTKSSCVLAWEYANPNVPMPELFEHIQDYYLWKHELRGTKEICACLNSYDLEFELWEKLISDFASIKELFITQGESIDRQRQKEIKELLALSTRMMVIGGVAVPVVNLPRTMASDAAGILAQDAPFAACYMDIPEYRLFSLRSVVGTGIDVSDIASLYGDGGGRPTAAGFSVPLDWQGDVYIPQRPTVGYILQQLSTIGKGYTEHDTEMALNPLIEYWKRTWAKKRGLKYTFHKDINYASTKEAIQFANEYCPSTHRVSVQIETYNENTDKVFFVGYVDIIPASAEDPRWEIHEKTLHHSDKDILYFEHSIIILKTTFLALLQMYAEEE